MSLKTASCMFVHRPGCRALLSRLRAGRREDIILIKTLLSQTQHGLFFAGRIALRLATLLFLPLGYEKQMNTLGAICQNKQTKINK